MKDSERIARDALRIVRKNPEITTISMIGKLMEKDYRTVEAALREMKALDSLKVVLLRRKAKQLADKIWGLIEHYKTVSDEHGHNATEHELAEAGGPTHKVYAHYFGSFRKFQWVIGMKPTEQGAHGHLEHRVSLPKQKASVAPLPIIHSGRRRQDAHGFRKLHRDEDAA